MPHQTTTRTARLEARISSDVLALVRRAAEIEGRSVSDFVVAAAREAAKQTITDVEVLKLSSEGQEKLIHLLLNPPPVAPALKRAFKRHQTLIRE